MLFCHDFESLNIFSNKRFCISISHWGFVNYIAYSASTSLIMEERVKGHLSYCDLPLSLGHSRWQELALLGRSLHMPSTCLPCLRFFYSPFLRKCSLCCRESESYPPFVSRQKWHLALAHFPWFFPLNVFPLFLSSYIELLSILCCIMVTFAM